MEKKLIVLIILAIAGLLGVGHLIQSPNSTFGQLRKSDDHIQQAFEEFQWKYGKVYNDVDEESKRYAVFSDQYMKIQKFNEQNSESKVAVNQFADLTDEEYETTYLTLKPELKKDQEFEDLPVTNRPSVVDWVGTLVWTGVNDQGSCGSCWAFSSTQALEGAYAKEYGKFELLSVQEVLDCAEGETGNLGCDGGLMDPVFDWVKKYGGICKRSEYPRQYQEKVFKCQKNSCTATLKNIYRHYDVPKRNKEKFLDHLAIVPLSIAVDAGQFAFRYYHSGIISTTSFNRLNHAVLAVGYDEKQGFIKGKNSWAESWGESGYFRLKIQEKGRGTLGVYEMACYPVYKGEDY